MESMMLHPISGRPIAVATRLTTAAIAALFAAQLGIAAPARAAEPGPLPDAYRQAILIYRTFAALDQANATGNYAVLRALAAPGFQQANPPDRLAAVFAPYREKGVALAPVVLFEPQLVERPAVGEDGMLRLKGYFPTEPLRINFDLAFEAVDGDWRLMSLSVTPVGGR